MDESFHARAHRLLDGAVPAALDFAMLSASLAAQAASSAAALAQARATQDRAAPLDEILTAGDRWREAAAAQRFCFNRAEARRARNAP